MKRAFQILAILLSIAAIAQAVERALAGAESTKESHGGHEPGV